MNFLRLIGVKDLKTSRLVELDILRSVAILLIVFYHLPGDEGFVVPGTPYFVFFASIMYFGLALFFFISGFVIDLHYKQIRTRTDVFKFYKKRAKRIYPPYWLALSVGLFFPILLAILLRFMNFQALVSSFEIPSLNAFIIFVNFLGLQTVFGLTARVQGIWFVGVILIYYAIYPLTIILSSNDVRKMIIVSLSVLVLFILYDALVVHIDGRFFLYYLLFLAGIVSGRVGTFYKKNALRDVLVCTTILSILVLLYVASTQFGLFSFIALGWQINAAFVLFFDSVMVVLILLAFTIARYFASALGAKARMLVFFIAFSSYCVFLLHTIFLSFIRISLRNVLHLGLFETVLVASLLGVPMIFLLCYHIQRSIDSLVANGVQPIANLRRPS